MLGREEKTLYNKESLVTLYTLFYFINTVNKKMYHNEGATNLNKSNMKKLINNLYQTKLNSKLPN